MSARRALLTALLLAAGSGAEGQTPGPDTRRAGAVDTSTAPTVTLVTFGPHRQVFERFGHNALLFHDPVTGEDAAYHWGLFDFAEPGFLLRFLTGDTRYWMGEVDARLLLEYEHRAGRPYTLQRLALTPAEALALQRFVRWNARPENRTYRYDYFRDNCSTRLRDALDRAVGGAIRRASDTVRTPFTYRSESVRLTAGDRPVQLGIDIALGRPADVPLTAWEAYFIPMRLRDGLRGLTVADSAGRRRPLVAEERTVLPPVLPVVELATAPRLAPRFALVGLALAAVVVLLRVMLVSRRSAAWGLALLGAAYSLVVGLLGVILPLMWWGTRHVFWRANENVLLFTPLSLLLVALLPAALLSGRFGRAAAAVAGIVAALAVVAAGLAAVPGGQESRAVVALFAPVHVALAAALLLPRARRAAPP